MTFNNYSTASIASSFSKINLIKISFYNLRLFPD